MRRSSYRLRRPADREPHGSIALRTYSGHRWVAAAHLLTDGDSQMRIAQLLRGGGQVPRQSAEQSSPNGPGQPVPQPMTPVLSDSRRNSAEAVTWPVRVAASWSWRLLIV